MKRMVREFFTKFNRIYELQAAAGPQQVPTTFNTPEALWGGLGLLEATRVTFDAHVRATLGEGRGATLLRTELMHAVNKVNYNQGNELNALTGSVSLMPTVGGQKVLCIKEGNRALVTRLLRAANARVHTGTPVAKVTAGVGRRMIRLALAETKAGNAEAMASTDNLDPTNNCLA